MDEGHTKSQNGEELRQWLALLHATGVGSRGFNSLLELVEEPGQLLRMSRSDLAALKISSRTANYLRNPDWGAVERDIEWAAQPNNHLLTLHDPRYPPLLAAIPDPPPLLYLHGNPEILQLPQLAIVGSRNPSRFGQETAAEFARHLITAGLTITSGLAIGIDGQAHTGALAAGGKTIAVTGTGLDRVYPASQRELAHRIAESGALLSEFSPGTPPLAGNFPRRNRIISGLSLGTLVVEAAQRSGSLITARLALEQGREVFAIPGSIHNPLARGCHSMIRQGAKLVETATDILEELGALLGMLQEESASPTAIASQNCTELDSDYQQLLDCVEFDPITADQLITQSGLTAESVSSMLLLLELEGYISSAPGGRYCRTGKKVPIKV
jgi:DNA processing protein